MSLETQTTQVVFSSSAPGNKVRIVKGNLSFSQSVNKGQVAVLLQGVGFSFKNPSLTDYENHLVKSMKARITNVRIREGSIVEFQVEFDFLDDSGNLGGGYVNVLAVAETN